jgi:hypothetical protein
MAMFGEVLFSLSEHNEAKQLSEIYREIAPDCEVKLVSVEEKGAHLIQI